jgi:hypothetical protein
VLSFVFQVKVILLELGGKYKGIHPHLSSIIILLNFVDLTRVC